MWFGLSLTEAGSAWRSQSPCPLEGGVHLLTPRTPGPSSCQRLLLIGCRACLPCVSLSEFKKSLEEAIRSDTSGHFQRLLISLSQVPFP